MPDKTLTARLIGGSRDGQTITVPDPPPPHYRAMEGPRGHHIRAITRAPGPYVSDQVRVIYDLQWWRDAGGNLEARYVMRGPDE